MTNFILDIKYTSNKNKAGKLKLLDYNGNILLKDDVILPSEMFDKNLFEASDLKLKSFIPKKYSDKNIYVDEKKINEFKEILGDNYLSGIGDYLLLKNNKFGGKEKNGFDGAITVSDKTFNEIQRILLENNNKINFVAKKKFFIFNQSTCERRFDVFYRFYKKIGENIEKEEGNLKNIIKTNVEKDYSSLEKNKEIRKDYDFYGKNKEVRKEINNQKGIIKNKKLYQANTNNDVFNDDIFDVLYMVTFPELAPFYKPNSIFALMLYFNNMVNRVGEITNDFGGNINFNGIIGDKVKEIKNDEYAYSMELYSDKEKNNYIGVAKYNENNGLIIEDCSGNKIIVSTGGDKSTYNMLIEGENKSRVFIEAIKDVNDCFVGNWTVEPNNSIITKSSFSLNNNFEMVSNPNKIINFNNFEENNDFKMKDDIQPPPPPPPPPQNEYTFTSDDPYSRTGYKM